jgi:AcrR family transcriptional regulator
MPRISEERRDARRGQIIDAARACVLEHGLEAVSMEMIIARSGLSTGAVYRYFKSKDDLIRAAITTATSEIGAAAAPVLADPTPALPSQLLQELLTAWVGYSRGGVGAAAGLDRMPVALHGWSYAQTDPETRTTLQASLCGFRERCVPLVKQWQTDGLIAADVEPDAVAQLILSICLGFVAQRSLTGDVGVQAHADALAALAAARPAEAGASGSGTP